MLPPSTSIQPISQPDAVPVAWDQRFMRVQMFGQMFGQDVQNTLWYYCQFDEAEYPLAVERCQEMASAFLANVWVGWEAAVSEEYTLVYISVEDFPFPLPFPLAATYTLLQTINEPGLLAGETIPSFNGWSFQMHYPAHGGTPIKRCNIAGIPEAGQVNGYAEAAQEALLTTLNQNLSEDLDDGGAPPLIRFWPGAAFSTVKPAPAAPYELTGVVGLDTKISYLIGHQDTRKIGRGS